MRRSRRRPTERPTSCGQETEMVRIVIDIEDYGDKLATKEAVAMALEPFGKVRVVQVIDGNEERRKKK